MSQRSRGGPPPHRRRHGAHSAPPAATAPGRPVPLVPRGFLLPFALLVSLFALWGLANNLTDVLLATFKRIMSMSDFQTSWIQLAFYGSYFCLALPAALFIRRFSYKAGVLLGLGMFAAGALLFYPASRSMEYGPFLVALFILAGGLSILETAANPYVLVLGPPETATRRLNLAQSFNPLGSIVGVLIGKLFILSRLDAAGADDRAAMSAEALAGVQRGELDAVMLPYLVIALVIAVVWLLIALTPFPRGADSGEMPALFPTVRRLLARAGYRRGLVAQFFYVGAQIGVWSYTIRYVMDNLSRDEESAAGFYLAAIVLFAAGRFLFTALMKSVAPGALLGASALLAAVLTGVAVVTGGMVGACALVAVSGCMSLMFPTIYGLAMEGLGEDTKIGASGLIMAILGGAVLTAVQGRISDAFGIHASYLVPLVAFLIIAWYGLIGCGPAAVAQSQHPIPVHPGASPAAAG